MSPDDESVGYYEQSLWYTPPGEGMLDLMSKLGAVCKWVLEYGQWVFCLFYWMVLVYEVPAVGLCGFIRRMRYWSGLRLWTRGRHWDRRSRYGER